MLEVDLSRFEVMEGGVAYSVSVPPSGRVTVYVVTEDINQEDTIYVYHFNDEFGGWGSGRLLSVEVK